MTFSKGRALILAAMLVLAASLLESCNPADKIDSSPSLRLGFSADTVLFDTVFTSIGSSTRSFMIYNHSNHRIRISDIRLAGSAASPFRINIDGQPGNSFSNVDIDAHDSLFAFVRVTINPNDQNAPFIQEDSLLFNLNGNHQKVHLVAWGQNAHYIVADTRQAGLPPFKIIAHRHETVTWTADKPYIIYGYGVVDSTARLVIGAGARVYFHNGSGLWVYRGGSLNVNGTIDHKVLFQGDRPESFYSDVPGQWDRIWINEGDADNEIDYAVIRNGYTGIQAETLDKPGTGKLILNNTIISNMTGYGLLTKQYNVQASNLLIYDAGIQSLYLAAGGSYDFRHCTFANYWNQSLRSPPSVRLSNYYLSADATGNIVRLKGDLKRAYFGNCQVIGNMDDELQPDNDPTAGTFNWLFDHSAVQTLSVSDASHYVSSVRIVNQYVRYPIDTVIPAVRDIGSLDVINASPVSSLLKYDLLGNDRTLDGKPDAGAIEYQPRKKSLRIR
ncbi:MAG: hypothetical protein Q8908_08875 [Bacteroidota bacterium]|nr:hypothetical protein [Bacteroidota bacterium]